MPTKPVKPVSKTAAFEFHGLSFTKNSGGQMVGDCPFCGKEGHFYVDPETGKWNCFGGDCGEKGNVYTFLNKLCEGHVEATNGEYKELAKERGIPAEIFQEHDWGYDKTLDRWMFPVYNLDESLANLYVRSDKGLMPTTGLGQHLYRGHLLKDLVDIAPKDRASTTVIVCEGHWDTLALENLRRKAKVTSGVGSYLIVGVPGATTFKDEWIKQVAGCTVWLMYDNDAAGQKGQDRAAKLLRAAGCNVRMIAWPSTKPDKYDLNDFVKEHGYSLKSWDLLVSMLREEQGSTLIDVNQPLVKKKFTGSMPTFDKLVKEFRKDFHLDDNMVDGLAVLLATTVGAAILSDPLWMFLVGPPGVGKTLILRAICRSDKTIYRSSITREALVSGWRPTNGQDSSLIPLLVGKTLVLKDYTEILGQSQHAQEELNSVLRGIFDGEVDRTFGNQRRVQYGLDGKRCYFNIFAGVTDEVHRTRNSTLGERFLKFEYLREGHDMEKHIWAALQSDADIVEIENRLQDLVAHFLSRDIVAEKLPSCSDRNLQKIVALAQLVGQLRTQAKYHAKHELAFRPRAEVATRVAKQLMKLSRCLAWVYGLRAVDSRCLAVVEKVALDTAYGWNTDIVCAMVKAGKKPLDNRQISILARMSNTNCYNRLQDMVELGIVERTGEEGEDEGDEPAPKRKGRPVNCFYTLSERVRELWKRANISTEAITVRRMDQGYKKGLKKNRKPITNQRK